MHELEEKLRDARAEIESQGDQEHDDRLNELE